MSVPLSTLKITSPSLRLTANVVPWDTEAFGFPVAQIYEFEVIDSSLLMQDYRKFEQWLDAGEIRIASCRLPHDRLRESIFLESRGFRFIEMVLHPTIEKLQSLHIHPDDLIIVPALESDLPAMRDIAERAFGHERYHIDPRLDTGLGDMRYGRWVTNSFNHPKQRLLKVMKGDHIVALFIVEFRENQLGYWHLTAIAPEWQGQGYGQRVWRAMLRHHQAEGRDGVMTTISARNVAVLNLYAKLDFRFLPPEMTFHWVRECK
jgi:RimJ/RimL family protein N-acetyltransferase